MPAVAAGRQVAEVAEKPEETYDRTDDPVRMYLREMGSVELLSREGEIAIAKRIEAGRELMIGALCESPLTFEALTVWRDELNEGKALLRDIIDLEAMYGGVPGAGRLPPAAGRSRRSGHARRARCAAPVPNGATAAVPCSGRRRNRRSCAARRRRPRRLSRRRRSRSRRKPWARRKATAKAARTPEGGEGGEGTPGRTTISTTRAICRSRRWKRR